MTVPVTDPHPHDAGGDQRSYRDLIADCVHCGFCLPACPTYNSWGEEMDSPRGRIDLMRGIDDGVIPLDSVVAGHIDACLGCMGCVTACPSGVRYDLLIEATRAKIEEELPRDPADGAFRNFVFALFPYPGRLRALAPFLAFATKLGLPRIAAGPLGKLLPARLRQLATMAPPVSLVQTFASLPARTPARGERRARVALVAGCVQRAFFPGVNAATLRVLAAEGCEVIVPPGQGCCGALSLHSGRLDEAKRFAQALIARFERKQVDAIIINAAGCGSTLKEYGELFAGDPAWAARGAAFAAKVQDISEYLAALEPRAPRAPLSLRVAYHDACHLAHAQRVREQPRSLLRTIPELQLLEIPSGDQCCGSAGTYNLFQPESAHEIGSRKVDNVQSVAPDMLASANPGCTLQIQSILRERGATLRAAHPIELLDASICGTSLP
ncbi:glycolate oxidase iron-sulfur subunit [Vulcanimicrobium alpinum]|uniref:Glycolate oxidase iron-sulfur subunit n=1 Tax=Vulcanimicrobium alpinum TaxID=3016050 RepID=A0AAN1XVE4_UNVUL|nr:(Fe-S)-binding protein [Vulcanimicrobium alpinum]BDE05695.1 glycolate oxidase iron-sulfur subunit [Vulcanimicrobium alpinum]